MRRLVLIALIASLMLAAPASAYYCDEHEVQTMSETDCVPRPKDFQEDRMDAMTWTFLGVGGLGGAGLAFGLRSLWWPPFRAGVFTLFARLTRRDVRDHPVRARILDAVGERPGISAIELAQTLGVNTGTLDYHLDVLVKDAQLRATKAGRNRILFLPGSGVDVEGVTQLSAQGRSDVARAIIQEPGVHATAISERLGLSRATVHHHLTRLEESGLVRVERGARVRCYPTERLGKAIEPLRRRRLAVLAKPRPDPVGTT